jgi:hypothetical protein
LHRSRYRAVIGELLNDALCLSCKFGVDLHSLPSRLIRVRACALSPIVVATYQRVCVAKFQGDENNQLPRLCDVSESASHVQFGRLNVVGVSYG